jgi:hypothetical protein
MNNDMWIYAGFFAIVMIIAWAFGFNFDEPFDWSNMLLFELIYPSK